MITKRVLFASVAILTGGLQVIPSGPGICRADGITEVMVAAGRPCTPGRLGRHSCEVLPTSASFIGDGSIGVVMPVMITNTGDYVFEGVIQTIPTVTPFTVEPLGPFSILPGSSHRVYVLFMPIECDTFYCTLKTGAQDVHLKGIGLGAGCSRTGPDGDFGMVPVGSYAEKEYWLKNNNCGDMYLYVGGDYSTPIDVVSGDGGFWLQPGDSHRVVVRFAPPEPGEYERTIPFGSYGGECNHMHFTGTGFESGGLLRLTSSRTAEGVRATYWLDEGGPATLKVYDSAGRLVRTLLNDQRSAGRHEHLWDLNNESGRPVTAGVYFVALEHAGHRRVEKAMVLR